MLNPKHSESWEVTQIHLEPLCFAEIRGSPVFALEEQPQQPSRSAFTRLIAATLEP